MSQPALSYQQILEDLARLVGLDEKELLATEEMVIDGLSVGLMLDGDEREGNLLFFSGLGIPAPQRLERIMRLMLQANHFWVGTGGCSLGLHPATDEVTLCGRIRLDELDARTLAALLDAYADTAKFWQAIVQNNDGPDEPVSFMNSSSAIRG